ncbi:MAG TPA: HDIG domain-containing protein [Phycisphaerae bacterium]|nr:HDIG domain-containing protein [Phycisphaerae bacterium]
MWPFRNRKKPPASRLEPRKPAAVNGRRRWRSFRAAGGAGSLLLAAALFAAVLAMDISPLEPLPYRPGGYVARDIYARVDFKVESPERTRTEQDKAADAAPAVIVLREDVLARIISDLEGFAKTVATTAQPADLADSQRKLFGVRTAKDLAALAPLNQPEEAKEYARAVQELGEELQSRFTVTDADFGVAYRRKTGPDVMVEKGGARRRELKARLLNVADAHDRDGFVSDAAARFPPYVRPYVENYLRSTFQAGVSVFKVDPDATKAIANDAREKVGTAPDDWKAGNLIVRRTGGRGLGALDFQKLAAEHEKWLTEQNALRPWRQVWLILGRAGLIAGVILFLGLYVWQQRPRVVKNHWRGFALAALLALTLLAGRVMAGLLGFPLLSVFGLFLAAVILTIAYDQRFALGVTAALVLLTALQLRLGTGQMLVLGAASTAAIFLLREVRTRSKLIEAGGMAAVVVFAGNWLALAARGVPIGFILKDGGVAALGAITAGFIAQGILPLIERIFGISTSLTLLEWCDASKPLLRRLAIEAPGTYSHALLLGSVCEAAAETIGTRGLLARVGAYYHDVGKINKPEYFIENQSGPASKHDKLSPAMSLLVIKGHVKEGLELAREFGLPRVLHEFIACHHGTTLVEYFYHAATAQRKDETDRAPEEVEFRYPGPRPRSKEAAILMLADASESSIRATPDPTPGRVETQVHQIVSKRLTDGQLDDCDLTLREVHAIESSLIKSLVSIAHGRIQYPSQKKPEPEEEAKPDAKPNGAPSPADSARR